ncbi:MAG TPA: outer membrane protein transport protein [Thermoanaerobaculia bacterium]|jgi:long-chain fatty acid transport protein|nr:outer membrane protein transport protein [Thermoanaerobaculia bacterium]
MRKLLVVCAFAALPVYGAGFDFAGQSARAMGMGGAYVAAVDDPSAIYYNPGALGLLKKKKGASIGVAMVKQNEGLFQGLPPGIAIGTTGEQRTPTAAVPHAFATLPFGKSAVLGIGTYSPFRMRTEWKDDPAFAGRFLARRSQIDVLDVATTLGVKAGPFGFGAGVLYRTAKLEASRRVAALLNGEQREIGDLDMRTDNKSAYGWTAGLMLRPSARFSWGASYRSRTRTEAFGVGKLTQIATGDTQLDTLVKASFPFGQDLALASTFEMPAQASTGIAFAPSKPLLIELDATRTQWGRISSYSFAFVNDPLFSTSYPLTLKDAMTYRAGLRFMFPTGPQVRIGYALEESPQPDETVGAFLADAERSTITAGVGLDWLDLAVAWTSRQGRIVTTNSDQLNGNWRGNEWMLLLTVTK